ncbi:thioesterase family protein [Burkholderiaceae bacterium DAT-1]|nr:thioesterase family protein [Burkholderiaceae bacterium DAT-1]
MLSLSDVLQSLTANGDGRFTATTDASWAQGRALFGGLQAALAMKAIRTHLPDAPPVWSLQTTFIAPIAPGEVEITVDVLRTGRAASQVEVRLLSEGKPACLVIALLGIERDSAVQVAAPRAPETKPVDAAPSLPFIPGIVPEFTRHYEYRWVDGSLPFSGGKQPSNQIYVRPRDAGDVDELAIIAMADAIPPVGLSLMKGPSPASSMTWALEFVQHPAAFPQDGWWLFDAEAISARDGYSSQTASIYAPDGTLVALSRQLVALFG